MSRTDWEGHFKFMILLLFFRKRLKILAFSSIQQHKSSSQMQLKTAYFLDCTTLASRKFHILFVTLNETFHTFQVLDLRPTL